MIAFNKSRKLNIEISIENLPRGKINNKNMMNSLFIVVTIVI